MVHLSALCLCLFVFVSVLIVLTPVRSDGRVVGVGQVSLRQSITRDDNTALVRSRIATATAVTQDGYDPGGLFSYPDVDTNPISSSESDAVYLRRFFVGQCTYWANMRYHQLTGNWVPWLGNAEEWASQALSYHWVVSDRPNRHGYSIMVMQPLVQGAGSYGHVAVVEHVNADGSVYTSNWNWNSGWRKTTYITFVPEHGISFIWSP
jgi:surface antigen